MRERLKAALDQVKQLFSFELFSFYHALCTLSIVVLALFASQYFSQVEAKWLSLTAILLSQVGLSLEVKGQRWWQLSFYPLCGLLLTAAVYLSSLIKVQAFSVVLVFSLSFLSCCIGWQRREFFFATVVFNLFLLLAFFSPLPLDEAAHCAYLILGSSLLVFFLRLLFFACLAPRYDHYAYIIFLQKLKYLYLLIFYNPEQENYLLGSPLEESHFQTAWSDCLAALQILKHKPPRSNKGLPSSLRATLELPLLDRIWDLTLSLGSLRYRLTDSTVLTLSHHEMKGLATALLQLIDQFIHPSTAKRDSASLEEAIQKLEELYQSTLQTVAKEPLVLLLFIQDLYALKEVFQTLALTAEGKLQKALPSALPPQEDQAP